MSILHTGDSCVLYNWCSTIFSYLKTNYIDFREKLPTQTFKIDKTGVFYISVAFHSHITCFNWPKNDRSTLKSEKNLEKNLFKAYDKDNVGLLFFVSLSSMKNAHFKRKCLILSFFIQLKYVFHIFLYSKMADIRQNFRRKTKKTLEL